MKPFVLTIIVVLVAIAAAGDVWGTLGMPFLRPPLAWRLAGVQAIVILGQVSLVKENVVRGVAPGRFLGQLVALNVAALAAYLSYCLVSGWEVLVGVLSIAAGVNFFVVARLLPCPSKPAADEKTNMDATLEQLAAAAVTGMFRERVGPGQAGTNGEPGRDRTREGEEFPNLQGMLRVVQGLKPGEERRLAMTVLVLLTAFEGGRLRAERLKEHLAEPGQA